MKQKRLNQWRLRQGGSVLLGYSKSWIVRTFLCYPDCLFRVEISGSVVVYTEINLTCNCSWNLLCSSLFSPCDQVVPGPSPCPASPGFLLPFEKRETLVPFVGLNNLGNTCYLNSVLQVSHITCMIINDIDQFYC